MDLTSYNTTYTSQLTKETENVLTASPSNTIRGPEYHYQVIEPYEDFL